MDELRRVVAETFRVRAESLSGASNGATVPGWDSVGHLNLVLAVEEHFHVRFTTEEISQMTDLASIQSLLDGRTRDR